MIDDEAFPFENVPGRKGFLVEVTSTDRRRNADGSFVTDTNWVVVAGIDDGDAVLLAAQMVAARIFDQGGMVLSTAVCSVWPEPEVDYEPMFWDDAWDAYQAAVDAGMLEDD